MDTPLIALLTDFGDEDFFVGSLKAVIAGINPSARTIDITHRVPSFDVEAGAIILRSSYRFFPRSTIFLAVVDPGVGTRRKILLAKTSRYIFVAPDNGIASAVLAREKIVGLRSISRSRFFLTAERTTFEARDRMAPVAAWLSLGLDPAEFGPRLQTYRERELPKMRRTGRGVRGSVLYVDKFGNLMTNIPARLALKRGVLRIGDREIRRLQTSYINRKPGEPFIIANSLGLLEVAVASGSAAEILGAGRGQAVDVLLK